jgi:HSP20 family protein
MTVFERAPLVDIIESDTEYLNKVELPKVKRENVKVTVQDGTLMISGERTIKNEEKGTKYHRVERTYGHFACTITLPEETDPLRIRAAFKDGVLNVHLAKTQHARPNRVGGEVA